MHHRATPVFRSAFLFVLFAAARLCGATALPPSPPSEVLADMLAMAPDSQAVLVTDVRQLTGVFNMHGPFRGESQSLYLFSDQTYASRQFYDIGAVDDQGKWSLRDGLLKLETDGTKPNSKSGTSIPLVPISLQSEGKVGIVLVFSERWKEPFSMLRTRNPNRLMVALGVFVLTRNMGFPSTQTEALRQHLNERYGGKYHYNSLDNKFLPKFAVATKQADGRWRLEGAQGPGRLTFSRETESPDWTLIEGKEFTRYFTGGSPEVGLAEVTIDHVQLRARQIEIGRQFDAVYLTGSVEIVGGLVPSSPNVAIFIEGKKMTP